MVGIKHVSMVDKQLRVAITRFVLVANILEFNTI